jgi:hypothetical protein
MICKPGAPPPAAAPGADAEGPGAGGADGGDEVGVLVLEPLTRSEGWVRPTPSRRSFSCCIASRAGREPRVQTVMFLYFLTVYCNVPGWVGVKAGARGRAGGRCIGCHIRGVGAAHAGPCPLFHFYNAALFPVPGKVSG